MTTVGDVPQLPPGVDARRRVVCGRARDDGTPVELAVAELGAGDRPAVVLAHGVGSSARFVAAAFGPSLLAAGWRLVTFDARGHGGSGPCRQPADHHLDAYAADLTAVVASTADVAAVGGISLGGHAALRWSGAAPRIVCLPAWRGRAAPGQGPHAVVADEVRRVGIGRVIERLRGETAMPTWLRDTLVTDYPRHDLASLTAALLALDGGTAPDDAEIAALPVPIGVVAWRDDPGHPFAVAEALAAAASRATLTELALTDLDVDLTRFGAAVVAALGSLGITP